MSQPLAPGAFAKALQDKRRGDRKRRWVLWGSIVGAVVLIGAAIYLFGFSPVFATHNVQVNGTSLLTEDEVREAAQVQLELPVLREDTGAIAERVRQLKPVRDVAVGRALPDTIVINVTERTLSYQVKEKGSVSWVDTEGVIYNTSAAGSDGVIQVSAPNADDRLRRDIATVVANLPDGVKADIESFSAKAVDRISFKLSGGREVVWGSAEESELKGQVLSALLSVEASVYDVSAPRDPITRK